MKKCLYRLFFTTILLHTYTSTYTMLTATRRISPGARSVFWRSAAVSPTTRAIVSPQVPQRMDKRWYSSQPPTTPQNQFAQEKPSIGIFERVLQWWRGNPAEVIEKVESKEYTDLKSLYQFLASNNQESINNLLDKLILNKTGDSNGIIALKDITHKIWLELLFKTEIGWDYRPNVIILKKLTDWTIMRLVPLLKQKFITTTDDRDPTRSFIGYLFQFDINKKISTAILENLQDICQTDTGLDLIKYNIAWDADKARSDLIGQRSYERKLEKRFRKGERAFKLWNEILETIEKNYQLYYPMLEKNYRGQDILSEVDRRIARKKEKVDQTIKE